MYGSLLERTWVWKNTEGKGIYGAIGIDYY